VISDETKEYNEIRNEIDGVIRSFRDRLNENPRILRPLQEASDAAWTKYNDRLKENK
jgi:hypothetical protein